MRQEVKIVDGQCRQLFPKIVKGGHYCLHSLVDEREFHLLCFRTLCIMVCKTPVTSKRFLVHNVEFIVTSPKKATSTDSFLTSFTIFRF